jgi:biopolymer transport protein ExbD
MLGNQSSHPYHNGEGYWPRARNGRPEPGAEREDVMKVSVMRDGRLYFRRDRVEPDELPSRIREAVGEGAERKIYATIDGRARNGDVEVMLDAIRASRITRIAIMSTRDIVIHR